jgi:predicted DCC family thiol-disulfide oxidoreductase YuxK
VVTSLLVYDGDCGFCTKSAKWAEAGLRPGADVQPWQALDLAELGLTEQDVTDAAWWFDERGAKHRGSHAAAEVLVASRARWRRIAGRVLRTPPFSWFAVPGYALIARYRYKLPGATDACRVPQRGS